MIYFAVIGYLLTSALIIWVIGNSYHYLLESNGESNFHFVVLGLMLGLVAYSIHILMGAGGSLV